MDVKTLWYSGSVSDWYERLLLYYHMPSVVGNYPLEHQLEMLKPEDVEAMTAEEFYTFLHDSYFKWKFTDCRWFPPNLRRLEGYETEGKEELGIIKDTIFSLHKRRPDGTRALMEEVTKIHCLGPAGGSGLLAILFPEHYGTIDQFMVKSLQKVGLPEAQGMDPENLTIGDAVVLEDIYRRKARELNASFGGNYWTPRNIDMVLWTFREKKDCADCKERKCDDTT